jgi:SAM-dependent methyltransferase
MNIEFYEKKYRTGKEIFRTNKLYAINLIEDSEKQLNILDVGCGVGINSSYIVNKGNKVTGIDISSEAIKKYKDKGYNGIVMDIQKRLDFNKDEFDIVFCSEVIEHITNPQSLMSEFYRVLRPGGKLILTTPNSAFWVYRILAIAGYPPSEIQHPKHFIFFSRRSLSKLFCASGFVLKMMSGRNMYILLPDPRFAILKKLFRFFRLKEEVRFVSGKSFWHISSFSQFCNSFFADTLIFVGIKKK